MMRVMTSNPIRLNPMEIICRPIRCAPPSNTFPRKPDMVILLRACAGKNEPDNTRESNNCSPQIASRIGKGVPLSFTFWSEPGRKFRDDPSGARCRVARSRSTLRPERRFPVDPGLVKDTGK
jgi:hypothetical protein